MINEYIYIYTQSHTHRILHYEHGSLIKNNWRLMDDSGCTKVVLEEFKKADVL